MADKNLQSITFPGLTDRYVVPQVDNTLTQAGRPADAKKTGDEITELKADLTAVETDIETGNLTAGTAKQLLSDTGMTDKSPYLFRAMPTGAGDREEPVIVGGSVVWNQLVKAISSENWAAESGVTATFTDGIATISSTTVGNGIYTKNTIPTYGGHKYAVMITAKGTSGQTLAVTMPSTGIVKYLSIESSDWKTYSLVLSTAQDANTRMYVFIRDVAYENLQIKNVVLTDLIVMFNSSIADYLRTLETTETGAGLAYLRKYGFFTKQYYPYSEPTFKHVEGLTAHRMVGFNQWDEEYEAGGLNINDGEKQTASDRIRSKNFIHVLPNTTYYLCIGAEHHPSGGNSTNDVVFYDENKAYIGYSNPRQTYSFTFTTPANCHYVMFHTSPRYGDTYYHDICINLSDPAKNGTYEPYKSYTYPLDPDVVLRGIPKLDSANNLYFDGDVYKADGTVSRRYIEVLVDGGVNGIAFSGAWGAEANGYTVYISTGLGARSYNTISDRFIVSNASIATMPLMSFVGNSGSSSTWSFVLPSTVTSLAEANTWASNNPFHIIIPRSTPTTETADPYAPLQLADPYGTEEWVLDDEAFPMPAGQETFYPENLRAKIEGLPWNFANLIAPTEVSNVATRNYTAGNLLIVDNILYKVTVNIANGGTITPGTNVTATTLAEIISALQ